MGGEKIVQKPFDKDDGPSTFSKRVTVCSCKNIGHSLMRGGPRMPAGGGVRRSGVEVLVGHVDPEALRYAVVRHSQKGVGRP